jgi:hypothetical protein
MLWLHPTKLTDVGGLSESSRRRDVGRQWHVTMSDVLMLPSQKKFDPLILLYSNNPYSSTL